MAFGSKGNSTPSSSAGYLSTDQAVGTGLAGIPDGGQVANCSVDIVFEASTFCVSVEFLVHKVGWSLLVMLMMMRKTGEKTNAGGK
jgi:hypothetical protein